MLVPVNERSTDFAKLKLARLEELKAARASREPELQQICDYIFPRRDFTLTKEPGSEPLRIRRLMDVKGMIAHERLSATLYGYMLSPHSPWTRPKLLSRDPKTYEEDAWFDHVSRRMHLWYSSASSSFRVTMAEDVLDITGFGTSVQWQDRGRNGPTYMAIPLRQNYWAENENGQIDTNYRVYDMTLRQALKRWPDSPGLREIGANTQKPDSRRVDLLHVVEPREDGRRGAVRDRKPWRDLNILVEKTEVLELGGHDRFKYNIGRFQKRAGDTLGHGAAWKALPFCKGASAVTEAWVRGAEKKSDPSLWTQLPRSTNFDRRPGAMNYVNALLSYGTRDANQLIQRLEETGDIREAVPLLQHFHSNIDQCFYVDWLTPHEGPQKTATEVYDLRDIRLRTMGPIVARLEHEKLNVNVEQTYEDLEQIDFFLPPPRSLHNEEIGFEFMGPLAISQRQGEVEGILRTIEAGTGLAKLDPEVSLLFKGEKILRGMADSYGMDGGYLASPKRFEEKREAQRQVGEMQEEMAAVSTAAQALRDGGQGAASLAGIEQAAA